MMKALIFSLLIGSAFLSTVFAQDRTDERKWTIDPVTNDTIYTEAVIISQTEDITPRNSMIVVNPLKFFLFYNLSFFQKINDGIVIGAGIQMPTVSGLTGFGVNAETRFYPAGKNLNGFYFAPNVSYNSLSDEESGETVSISSIGGLIGWQWFPGEQFAIGLGIGIDYYFFSGNDDSFSEYNGTAPLVRFDIGYAW